MRGLDGGQARSLALKPSSNIEKVDRMRHFGSVFAGMVIALSFCAGASLAADGKEQQAQVSPSQETLVEGRSQAATKAKGIKQKFALTLEGAKAAAAAAEAEALKNNWKVVIAIVDDGGHLLYLQRLDGTQAASGETAILKARTAALFKRPTKALEDAVTSGRVALLSLPHATPLEGGLPIDHQGDIIGAIGVSGATSAQDAQVAKAGTDTLATLTQ